MPFRAILFDIGDTLWHAGGAPPAEEFRRLAAERAAAALAGHGVGEEAAAAYARAAWKAMESAMALARETTLIEPDYGAEAQGALLSLGLTVTRAAAADFLQAIYVSGAEGGKAAYADAVPTLAELRSRGFKLGIVTNRAFGGERFRADLREAGLDIGWDATAVSVEVGFLKPHPALFEAALARLGVAAEEALMVGNSLAEDIAGAQRLGMAAAWRRSTADAEGVVPDYVFDEVAELLAIPELATSAR